MLEVLIRLAQPHEIPDFRRIDAATDHQFIEAGHPELAGDGEYIPEPAAVRGIAENRIFVAEVDSKIVGWTYLTRLDEELCVGQIAVLPTFQQKGVGTAMMTHVVNEATEHGETSIILNTQSDLRWNKPWYETLGFVTVPRSDWTKAMADLAIEQQSEGGDWQNTRVHMRLVLGRRDPAVIPPTQGTQQNQA